MRGMSSPRFAIPSHLPTAHTSSRLRSIWVGTFRSRMAQMAQDSVAASHGQLIDLIRALFTFNQLLRYARDERALGIPDTPADVLNCSGSLRQIFKPIFVPASNNCVPRTSRPMRSFPRRFEPSLIADCHRLKPLSNWYLMSVRSTIWIT